VVYNRKKGNGVMELNKTRNKIRTYAFGQVQGKSEHLAEPY